MKFVIRLFALCTFIFIYLQPSESFGQDALPAIPVGQFEINPDQPEDEIASASTLGSISGKAFGAAKSTATIFQVTLYGPDDPKRLYASSNFGQSRQFHFDKLPIGTYWIQVSSGAGTVIKALPRQEEFLVEPGKNYISDVEFRAR